MKLLKISLPFDLDDLLVIAGVALVAVGAYQLDPRAPWFVVGGFCLLAGVRGSKSS